VCSPESPKLSTWRRCPLRLTRSYTLSTPLSSGNLNRSGNETRRAMACVSSINQPFRSSSEMGLPCPLTHDVLWKVSPLQSGQKTCCRSNNASMEGCLRDCPRFRVIRHRLGQSTTHIRMSGGIGQGNAKMATVSECRYRWAYDG
jgi:hypothetical protein